MSGENIFGKSWSSEDIKIFIYRWNTTYPIDRWWREKHQIAFNSPAHRVVCFLDMYVEWMEDKIYTTAITDAIKDEQYKVGDWLKSREEEVDMDQEIREFEKMDLSKFDDKEVKNKQK